MIIELIIIGKGKQTFIGVSVQHSHLGATVLISGVRTLNLNMIYGSIHTIFTKETNFHPITTNERDSLMPEYWKLCVYKGNIFICVGGGGHLVNYTTLYNPFQTTFRHTI